MPHIRFKIRHFLRTGSDKKLSFPQTEKRLGWAWRNTASPVQPMDGPKILEPVVLGQNEDDSVVPVAAAWMHLSRGPSDLLVFYCYLFFCLRGRFPSLPWDFIHYYSTQYTMIMQRIRIIVGNAGFELTAWQTDFAVSLTQGIKSVAL